MKYHVEIRLLPGPCIDVVVEAEGRRRRVHEVESATQAFEVLREHLEGDERCAVTLRLSDSDGLRGTWTTKGGTSALYWAAVALGNACNERSVDPEPVTSVVTESGPVRVKARASATHPGGKERVA